jgi:hypothetical protein
VPFCAVVGNVTGLMRGDCCGAAFAFGCWVVIVQVTRSYAAVAEVTGHTSCFSFRIEIWLKEPLLE